MDRATRIVMGWCKRCGTRRARDGGLCPLCTLTEQRRAEKATPRDKR